MDTLTVTLDTALDNGVEFDLWSTTGSNAPGHTLSPNGGATIAASNFAAAASLAWPNGVTRVTVKKINGNWFAAW